MLCLDSDDGTDFTNFGLPSTSTSKDRTDEANPIRTEKTPKTKKQDAGKSVIQNMRVKQNAYQGHTEGWF